MGEGETDGASSEGEIKGEREREHEEVEVVTVAGDNAIVDLGGFKEGDEIEAKVIDDEGALSDKEIEELQAFTGEEGTVPGPDWMKVDCENVLVLHVAVLGAVLTGRTGG